MPFKMTFVCMAIACYVTNSQGATVVSNTHFNWSPASDPLGRWNYVGTIWQDVSATDPTSAWFKYDGATIRCVSRNTDESSDYYLVDAGDAFGPAAIASGLFSPLVDHDLTYPAIPVGTGQPFYLGVSTSRHFQYPERSVFGWIRFEPAASLAMTANVMSYESSGIIVGTTTLVPEPSLLAAISATFLFRRHVPRRV